MPETQLEPIRHTYDACPLCESPDIGDGGTADCTRHPLHRPEFGDTIAWMACHNCGHVFTSGWLTEAGEALLFERGHDHQTPGAQPSPVFERTRKMSAQIVTTVAHTLGALEGRWLDVGFGDGALLTTAAEFGFDVVGLERRAECVERLRAFHFDVQAVDLADYEPDAPFDVISLADVLEHMPFPRVTIERVHDLLAPGGLVFVSMPNRQSYAWRLLDERGENPYWGEIEHYHNFGRDGLYALLATSGFQPCHYAVSERYRACMEVVAAREEIGQAPSAA